MVEFIKWYLLVGMLLIVLADWLDPRRSIWWKGWRSAFLCYAIGAVFWPLFILSVLKDKLK